MNAAPTARPGRTAGSDKTLRVWDLPTGKELRRFSGNRFATTWEQILTVSSAVTRASRSRPYQRI
jgi:hypothetical protein